MNKIERPNLFSLPTVQNQIVHLFRNTHYKKRNLISMKSEIGQLVSSFHFKWRYWFQSLKEIFWKNDHCQ